MFQEWGFLISEMIVLIVLAALLGLLVGWLIWGRRATGAVDTSVVDRLRADLAKCRADHAEKDAQLAEAHAARTAALVSGEMADLATLEGVDATAIEAEPIAPGTAVTPDFDGDGVPEGRDEGEKPEMLSAARDGAPDDLKQIKGIGPKLEQLCHQLGVYHFDQIAAWTPQEIAWVDANLEGFRGRVSRDQWVEQAKVLAGGGETEFSKRVEDGGVY